MRFTPLILLCLLGFHELAAQEVSFTKRPTQVKDTSHQKLVGNLVASRTIRQHKQIVDSSKQTLVRNQERRLTVLEMANGVPVRGKLVYGNSGTVVKAEQREQVAVTQPVAGNTYFILRRGDELLFGDESGQPVTEEEAKVLKLHMSAFGKPNPLAEFLNGKRIQVGQSIEVPKEVAIELLGLTGREGNTDRLVLRLRETKVEGRTEYAIFETILKTSGGEAAMAMLMKGQLIVETGTCRTKSIQLHGPISMSEVRGPTEGRFSVDTNGTLQLTVQTEFANETNVASAKSSTTR